MVAIHLPILIFPWLHTARLHHAALLVAIIDALLITFSLWGVLLKCCLLQ